MIWKTFLGIVLGIPRFGVFRVQRNARINHVSYYFQLRTPSISCHCQQLEHQYNLLNVFRVSNKRHQIDVSWDVSGFFIIKFEQNTKSAIETQEKCVEYVQS